MFLFARWSYLAEGLGHFGDVPGQVDMYLDDGTIAEDNFPEFMARLDSTLSRITPRHNVIIIQTFPKYDVSIPIAMIRNLRFGAQLPLQTREVYAAREARTNRAVAALAATYGAQVLAPQDLLCANGTCAIEQDGVPLYFDQVHLSPKGNDVLRDLLFEELEVSR